MLTLAPYRHGRKFITRVGSTFASRHHDNLFLEARQLDCEKLRTCEGIPAKLAGTKKIYVGRDRNATLASPASARQAKVCPAHTPGRFFVVQGCRKFRISRIERFGMPAIAHEIVLGTECIAMGQIRRIPECDRSRSVAVSGDLHLNGKQDKS